MSNKIEFQNNHFIFQELIIKSRSGKVHKVDRFRLFRLFLKSCQLFGTFPLEILPQRSPEFTRVNRKSFGFWLFLFFSGLGTFWAWFQTFSFFYSIWRGHPFITLLLQVLTLISSTIPTLNTYTFLLFPGRVQKFFKDWIIIEEKMGLKQKTLPNWVRHTERLILIGHLLLALGSGFMVWHATFVPNYPSYILYYLPGSPKFNGPGFRINFGARSVFSLSQILIQDFLIGLTLVWICSGHSILEGTLSFLALRMTEALAVLEYDLKSGEKSPREVLRSFHLLANYLRGINDFFGLLLLIYFGEMIIGICIPIFNAVRWMSMAYSDGIEPEHEFILLLYAVAIYFGARTIVFMLCLSSVHSQIIRLGKTFARVNLETDTLTRGTRLRILSLLTFNLTQPHPMTFSLLGFTYIYRGALLSLSSVILSYIVILYQTID